MQTRRRWLFLASIVTGIFCGQTLAIGWLVHRYQANHSALAAVAELDHHSTLIAQIQNQSVAVAIALGVVLLIGYAIIQAIIARYEVQLARSHADVEQHVRRRVEAMLRNRDAIICGLVQLADSRDNETGQHLERIRAYSAVLVGQLALSEPAIDATFAEELPLASTLHDIGKVGIPDAILRKPGPFSAAERTVMQQHAIIGGECLSAIQTRLGDDHFIELARQIALAHHERWDGGGYPFGLSGEQIPLAARIVALADTYDALTSRRVYKFALDHDTARSAIVLESGGQFDPSVVEAFLACEDELRKIAEAIPSDPLLEVASAGQTIGLGDWPTLELAPAVATVIEVEADTLAAVLDCCLTKEWSVIG